MITSTLTTADTENETGNARGWEKVQAGVASLPLRKSWVWGRWLSASPGEREMRNLAFGTPEEVHQHWDGSGVVAAVLDLFVRERTQ